MSTAIVQTDLRDLIAHSEWVDAHHSLEDVYQRFGKSTVEFMAVLDGDQLVGSCCRRDVGMLLGSQFGFALFAKKPIGQHLQRQPVRVVVGSPITDVLGAVFSRDDADFYDDVLLVDGDGRFLGFIYVHTLVRLQTRFLLENIEILERQQQEINQKNEQMRQDLLMARELQQAMLPQEYPIFPPAIPPAVGAVRFGHCYYPAETVGGDFCLVSRLSETRAGVLLCDVMGHGVRSALVTAIIRALFEGQRSVTADPADYYGNLNRELISILQATRGPMFVTACYLVINAANGGLQYGSAGHPLPLRLRRQARVVDELPTGNGHMGSALGLFQDAVYETCEAILPPGDVVVLFTDGLYEISDAQGEEYGRERLAAALRQRADLSLDLLLNELVAEARRFSPLADLADDICLLAVEMEAETESPSHQP